MSAFSVLILTAVPPGMAVDGPPPAYVKIDGREALLRSVELFLNRGNVKQVLLGIMPDRLDEAKQKFGAHLGFSGVKLVAGGPRWIDQLAAADALISPEATHVVVHDAARVAVPAGDIDEILAEAEKSPAAALSAPVRSILAEVDEGGAVVGTRAPQEFVQLLTPQVYRRDKFAEMARSRSELHPSQLALVRGSGLNVRISSSADATLVKAMVNLLPRPKLKANMNPFEEAQW
jgi:2-C-methyl-D-erythritol 4-phosphate cytidylyltransferase